MSNADTTSADRGAWLLTATGAQFHLRWITRESISILDIAHALANVNRYTGHALRPISVAEHCLLVVEIMEREMAVHDPAILLAALLHDAHEAYTSDLATPMKELIGKAWTDEETRIQHHVLDTLGALPAYLAHADWIKAADLAALATERRDLLPDAGPAWPALAGIQPVPWVDLRHRDYFAWSDWRQAYLDRYAELREHLRLLERLPVAD